MFRSFFAGVLVAVPIANVPIGSEVTTNLIAHEPVVLYEVTGGTLLGPYDLSMIVYGDGQVHLSSAVMNGQRPRAVVAHVGAAEALQLATDLADAGAYRMQDQDATVTDVPLHTLTVLRGASDGQAHTYSWWIPDGTNQRAAAVVHDFIARHFRDF